MLGIIAGTTYRHRLVLLFLGLLFGCHEARPLEAASDQGISAADAARGNIDQADLFLDMDLRQPDNSSSRRDFGSLDVSLSSDGWLRRDQNLVNDSRVPDGQPCERTYQCPFPQVCSLGACDESVYCEVDSDCVTDYICNPGRNRCVHGCRRHTQCPSDRYCDDWKCLEGLRCTQDTECPLGETCKNTPWGAHCTLPEPNMETDVGVEVDASLQQPDGGIYTCDGTQCDLRQVCGPHPNSSCLPSPCLSEHGGDCETNCDCNVQLICKQATNKCVSCLNGLQCDAPLRCIPTGQCAAQVMLQNNNLAAVKVLEKAVECAQGYGAGACAQFIWQSNPQSLHALNETACNDPTYADVDETIRNRIQAWLNCESNASMIVLDPSYDPNSETACSSILNHRFILHGCAAENVPLF